MSNKAIQPADFAHAKLQNYRRRVDSALAEIQRVADNPIGISFSSGKDSIVVLDLVKRIQPNAPVGFYDSGDETEFDETYQMVEFYKAQKYKSEIELAEMCRIGGYWGYEHPSEPGAKFDWVAFLVLDPAMRFATEHHFEIMALGLRGDESFGRKMSYIRRGKFYPVQNQEPVKYHLCPIADWSDNDVWAYIADNNLPYNPIYDLMAQENIPRHEWRISVLLGRKYSTYGRYSFLRRVAPKKWSNLSVQFPEIARLT